jgi:predicted TIM-barrel fold metal-dependent hydrolase
MTSASSLSPPLCLDPAPLTRRPRHSLPDGATDCHCHVFESPQRYPLIADRSYTPPAASRAQYQAMCAIVGLERTVQVNASVYGADNSVSLDVIESLGQDRARGVAGVAVDVSAAELERLHAGGMRGARVSTHVKGYGGTDAIAALAPRLKPFGWHLQVHLLHVDELVPLEKELLAVPVPLVFDHMGGARGNEGPARPGFKALLRILRKRDDCWTKISSWYRRSDAGGPAYPDMKPFVEALVEARPDRLVFGTNWPHPALFAPQTVPNDGDLIDLFCGWVPDVAVRNRIFAGNPARLYGFEE